MNKFFKLSLHSLNISLPTMWRRQHGPWESELQPLTPASFELDVFSGESFAFLNTSPPLRVEDPLPETHDGRVEDATISASNKPSNNFSVAPESTAFHTEYDESCMNSNIRKESLFVNSSSVLSSTPTQDVVNTSGQSDLKSFSSVQNQKYDGLFAPTSSEKPSGF